MARKLLVALAAAALFAFAAVGVASAQPPTTTTTHSPFSETFVDEVCNGEFAEITLEGKIVFHETVFDDGRYHLTGTIVADFTWTQSGVTYTGHVTQWFGENSNKKNFNGTFTVNGQGKGSDGSKVSVKGVAHFTVNANGEVTAAFERFSIECR
ncbi:MAG: hypothetical protein FJ320_07110 [SAR202 cluster bacterium]|nr:hypothetical protein [SAR202 cluster bacterium]